MKPHFDFQALPVFQMLEHAPLIPILTVHHVDEAIPLAQAFAEGGMHVLEVTLRTPVAIDVIKAMKKAVPKIKIGAGTVLTPGQFAQVKAAGADFAVSPGLSKTLVEAAKACGIPYLPGVTTASEVMAARDLGVHIQKLFPAEVAGGVKLLKSLQPIFPDVKFVATGGISVKNMDSYLDLDNILAVGGSWIATQPLIEHHDWGVIAELTETVLHHQRKRAQIEN